MKRIWSLLRSRGLPAGPEGSRPGWFYAVAVAAVTLAAVGTLLSWCATVERLVD
ncbi:MAG TPA: hypothetical protein VK457_02085 [Chloroflexota bacterium]|nr:hypothetical protein [Chloroflexota bacterium]